MKQERILMIVESPNKVKTLKQFLPSNYIVMASVGHISEIKDGGNYWNTGIEPDNGFKTNYVVSSDKKDVAKKLKDQVELASKVIIASDPDREGEAIAWSLKKFLKIPNNKYERVTFHEITKNAVLKALENPRKIDDALVSAAQARQKLDKILGYRLSPIAKKQIQAKSVGRCQSAGLKLICNKEEEINKFVVETYFDLYAYFTKHEHQFKAKYKGTCDKPVDKIISLAEADAIMDACKAPFKIVDVVKKEKLEYPKAPFTTSTFQQEVSSKLGIGVKEAMSYAQKLFEGLDVDGKHIALITYIRTDSPEFAPEFLPILETYVRNQFGNDYYAPIKKAKKADNTQDGHEAIRPVDLDMTPEKLSRFITDKKLIKVYEIIRNRTLATMMQPSKISETIYTIHTAASSPTTTQVFEFNSKEQSFDGFKKIYKYEVPDDDDDDRIVSETFNKNETLNVDYLEPIEKHTNPPKRYKEATLIKELESTGIGRPSTFATIVSTLLDEKRGYCTTKDKFIVPTDKGIELSHFLDKNFSHIINVDYTSNMETDLDKIATGKLNDIKFLEAFYTNLESTIQQTKTSQESSSQVCPRCGAPMVVRTGKYGKFLGCSKYPKCKGIKKIEQGEKQHAT